MGIMADKWSEATGLRVSVWRERSSMDLYSMDLYSTDLYSTDLHSMDLYCTDLYSMDLYSMDLYSMDLVPSTYSHMYPSYTHGWTRPCVKSLQVKITECL